MKKLVSVNGKQHNAVFAVGFTLQVGLGQGVTVFLTAAYGKPSAIVMIVCFPNQAVAQIGILDLGDQCNLSVPAFVPHLVSVQQLDIRAAAEFNLDEAVRVIKLLKQM